MRRKILRIAVAAALVGALLIVPAYAESAMLIGSDVNLRAGPGTNYRVLDCLAYGTELTVTDRSGDPWYAVDYNGTAGFISAAYLDIREEDHSSISVNIQPIQSEESAYINAMYVRFRSGPGSEYSILGEFNKGKQVRAAGTVGSWTACEIDGRAGYVFSDYISYGTYSAPYAGASDPETDIYLGGGAAQITPKETPMVQPSAMPAEPGAASPAPAESAAPVPTAPPLSTVMPVPTATPVPTVTPSPAASIQPVAVTGAEPAEGYINANYVCFRTGPSTSYSIIDQFNRGTELTITGTYGDWTACVINGDSGYVYSLYVSRRSGAAVLTPVMDEPMENENAQPAASAAPTPVHTDAENKTGYISGNNVRLRSGASMSSAILDELFYGNDVVITGKEGDWTAVIYDGTPGYVYSQYVKEGSLSAAISNAASADNSGGSALGRQIADYALQFVGYNYTWGGKAPSTGFDCSGLVYYVFSQFGYSLNRVAEDQARNGVAVTGDLQPGDILCFYSGSSYIGHVGIYIGNGMFVHAQNSATGVVITELAGSYANRGYVARRIV